MNSALLAYLKSHPQPMKFHDYMKAVLYAPGLGYYSSSSAKFGPQGDFITAPELNDVFAKCLANQFAQVLKNLNHGVVLELGAGTGQLALDLLKALRELGQLPEQYWIIELSGDLKSRQMALIESSAPELFKRVKWLDYLPQDSFEGIIFGNEVLDAMPVHRFIKSNGKIFEQGVQEKNGHLSYCQMDPSETLTDHVHALENELGVFQDKYYSEVNLAVKPWLASLQASLSKGIMLFVDYGYDAKTYYHPERMTGTLQCYYHHQVSDNPLEHIGEQDITAHVDFTHVASSAIDLDLDLLGYTTQMYFLMHCQLEKIISANLDVKTTQHLRRLLMPGGMGEVFKVIALGKNYDHDLMGFKVDKKGDL